MTPASRLKKLLLWSLPALFLASAVFAGSRDLPGFEGIPFGTPRAEVINLLCQRLKIDKVQAFAGIEYRGPNGLRLTEEEEDVVLQGYRFNGTRADAVLFFNVNQKFFRLQYEAQKRPSGYFETTIKDDAKALSASFQKLFGAPTFKMNPRISEMRPGARSYFWRWTRGRETIYTAIVANEMDFGAVAVLSDDAFLKETPLPLATPAATDFPSDFTTTTQPVETPVPPVDATPTPEPAPEATPDPAFVPAQDDAPAIVPAAP